MYVVVQHINALHSFLPLLPTTTEIGLEFSCVICGCHWFCNGGCLDEERVAMISLKILPDVEERYDMFDIIKCAYTLCNASIALSGSICFIM